jgi:putative endonuclease
VAGEQHRAGRGSGFVAKYKRTGWFIWKAMKAPEAIQREKQLKNWKRDWKISLIEADNPEWMDLMLSTSGLWFAGTTQTRLAFS